MKTSNDTARDWREHYVICKHVADDREQGTRHSGFRVCCESCWRSGFLTAEPMTIERRGPLAIGRHDAPQADTK